MSSTEPSPGFKPKKSVALSGTAAGNTALCTVGHSGNDLHYRGYDIKDLAAHCAFEEVAYLLVHGVIKLALVAGLLRGLRWMFPLALIVLAAFIGYQLYRFAHIPSWSLGLFTLLDVVVVALIAREWRVQETHEPRPG